jgi:hypothetical protein
MGRVTGCSKRHGGVHTTICLGAAIAVDLEERALTAWKPIWNDNRGGERVHCRVVRASGRKLLGKPHNVALQIELRRGDIWRTMVRGGNYYAASIVTLSTRDRKRMDDRRLMTNDAVGKIWVQPATNLSVQPCDSQQQGGHARCAPTPTISRTKSNQSRSEVGFHKKHKKNRKSRAFAIILKMTFEYVRLAASFFMVHVSS